MFGIGNLGAELVIENPVPLLDCGPDDAGVICDDGGTGADVGTGGDRGTCEDGGAGAEVGTGEDGGAGADVGTGADDGTGDDGETGWV